MEFYRGSGAPEIDEEVNVILESSSMAKHRGNRWIESTPEKGDQCMPLASRKMLLSIV